MIIMLKQTYHSAVKSKVLRKCKAALYLKCLTDSYKEWSENKFTRHIISQPEVLHLLWAFQRGFLITAGNTTCQFTCHLWLIVFIKLNRAARWDQWSKERTWISIHREQKNKTHDASQFLWRLRWKTVGSRIILYFTWRGM
jgi:hypothetical protein